MLVNVFAWFANSLPARRYALVISLPLVVVLIACSRAPTAYSSKTWDVTPCHVVGSGEYSPGSLNLPGSLTLDSNNNLYVGGYSWGAKAFNRRARVDFYDARAVEATHPSKSVLGFVDKTTHTKTPQRFIDLYRAGHYNGPFPLAFDANQNLYVGDVRDAAVLVFDPDATGTVKPLRTIRGQRTLLKYPMGLAFDKSGNLYVVNNNGEYQTNSSVLVFPPGADGNVAPVRQLEGPKTQLLNAHAIALGPDGSIYVSGGGPFVWPLPYFINVYSADASGDVAPERRIMGNLRNTNDLVPSQSWLSQHEHDPAVMDPQGTQYEPRNNPGLNGPVQMAFDSTGNLWVANVYGYRITEYPPGVSGDVKPIGIIEGGKAGLDEPSGVAIDSNNNIYVSNFAANSANVYCLGK